MKGLCVPRKVAEEWIVGFWMYCFVGVSIVPRMPGVLIAFCSLSTALSFAFVMRSEARFRLLLIYLGFIIAVAIFSAGTKGNLTLLYYSSVTVFALVLAYQLWSLGFLYAYRLSRNVLWLLLAGCLFLYFQGDLKNDLEVVYIGGSSNYVTAVLISVLGVCCISSWAARAKMPLVLSLLVAIVCIALGGRAGLIIGGAIFSVNVVVDILFNRQRRGLTITLLLAILIAYLSSGFDFSLIDDALLGRLVHGLGDDGRAIMRSEYLACLNFMTLFSGCDYEPAGLIAEFKFNPHNSFIRIHHLFGLPLLLWFGWCLVYVFARLSVRITTLKFYALFIVFLVFVRGVVDSVYFALELDFVVYYALLVVMYQKSKNSGDTR